MKMKTTLWIHTNEMYTYRASRTYAHKWWLYTCNNMHSLTRARTHTKFTIKKDLQIVLRLVFSSTNKFLHSLVFSAFMAFIRSVFSLSLLSNNLSIPLFLSGLLFALQWNFCEWFFWCIWIDLNILCLDSNCSVDFCYMDCKTVKTSHAPAPFFPISLARLPAYMPFLFSHFAFCCWFLCSSCMHFSLSTRLLLERSTTVVLWVSQLHIISSHESSMIRCLKTD